MEQLDGRKLQRVRMEALVTTRGPGSPIGFGASGEAAQERQQHISDGSARSGQYM